MSADEIVKVLAENERLTAQLEQRDRLIESVIWWLERTDLNDQLINRELRLLVRPLPAGDSGE